MLNVSDTETSPYELLYEEEIYSVFLCQYSLITCSNTLCIHIKDTSKYVTLRNIQRSKILLLRDSILNFFYFINITI